LPAGQYLDETPLTEVELPTRLRNALAAEGVMTVGDVRDLSDANLRSFQNVGDGYVRKLRQMFGPSRILSKSQAARPSADPKED
jgi:DNA-directed RNA polymerase alpha subunit